MNNIDLVAGATPGQSSTSYQGVELPLFHISAKTEAGLEQLIAYLKQSCGYQASGESAFIARERHLIALEQAQTALNKAIVEVSKQSHLELVAEDLRIAQQCLGSITGQVSSDDLLGEIFSSFCIGK